MKQAGYGYPYGFNVNVGIHLLLAYVKNGTLREKR
jgi:hypothetical protein